MHEPVHVWTLLYMCLCMCAVVVCLAGSAGSDAEDNISPRSTDAFVNENDLCVSVCFKAEEHRVDAQVKTVRLTVHRKVHIPAHMQRHSVVHNAHGYG